MKQQLYISKDYLIANTIIGVNKLEGRTIADDKDISTVENLFKNNMRNRGYEVTFHESNDNTLEDDIFEKDNNNGKLYILLPWSSIDTLIDKYQNKLPFSTIKDSFNEILSNKEIKRNINNNNLINTRIAELLDKNVFAPRKKVTNTKVKEYYVSQR
ncbi:MAG: hypothetical protein IJI43_00315 [Bacilli bacterium]|nr:hypothetical protein [Bacilli bacterium]